MQVKQLKIGDFRRKFVTLSVHLHVRRHVTRRAGLSATADPCTLESLITEDGECTTEFRSRLNGGQAIRASLQKIWKSHSITISTKIRLMKALVWPVVIRTAVKAGHSGRMKKHVLRPLR